MSNNRIKELRTKHGMTAKEFAESIGVSRPSISNYESGRQIPGDKTLKKIAETYNVSIAWLKGEAEDVTETARMVKTAAEIAAPAAEEIADQITAEKIEAKKTVRKAGRKAKETVEDAAAIVREAADDKAVAEEIEVKKTVRKNARKKKEAAEIVVEETRKAKRRVSLDIVIESPMGGAISADEIAKKVPKNTSAVYVRVDENKLYYVLKNGKTGAVDIWE